LVIFAISTKSKLLKITTKTSLLAKNKDQSAWLEKLGALPAVAEAMADWSNFSLETDTTKSAIDSCSATRCMYSEATSYTINPYLQVDYFALDSSPEQTWLRTITANHASRKLMMKQSVRYILFLWLMNCWILHAYDNPQSLPSQTIYMTTEKETPQPKGHLPSNAREYIHARNAGRHHYARNLSIRNYQPPPEQHTPSAPPVIPDDQEIYEHNGQYFINPKFRLKQEAERQRQEAKIRAQSAGSHALFSQQSSHLASYAESWKHDHPDRMRAFSETLANPTHTTYKSYALSPHAIRAIRGTPVSYEISLQLTGHALQHELMSETMHGIERAAKIDRQNLSPLGTTLYQHAFSTLEDARKSVMIGDCLGSSQCIDFVNVMIDYVTACATGIAEGGTSAVKNTVQGMYNVVMHPQETLQQLGDLAHIIAQGIYQFIPPELELSAENYEQDLEVYQYHCDRIAENWKTASDAAWDYYQKTPGPDIARKVTHIASEIPLSVVCAHQCSSLMSKLIATANISHAITRAKSLVHQSVYSSRIAHTVVNTIQDISLALKRNLKSATQHITSKLEQYFSLGNEVEVALASGETLSSESVSLLCSQITEEMGRATHTAPATEVVHGEIFEFTKKTISRMEDKSRMIPIHILKDILDAPLHVLPDPQGTSALMHYARMWRNGKLYNVEVLYDLQKNLIMHFLFTDDPLGPLMRTR